MSRPWLSRHRDRRPPIEWELACAAEGEPRRQIIGRMVAELASTMWAPDRSPRAEMPCDVATTDDWL